VKFYKVSGWLRYNNGVETLPNISTG